MLQPIAEEVHRQRCNIYARSRLIPCLVFTDRDLDSGEKPLGCTEYGVLQV